MNARFYRPVSEVEAECQQIARLVLRSSNRNTPEQVIAANTMDAAIEAIERGAERVEARASGEVSDPQSKAYHQALVAQVDRNNVQGHVHG